MLKLVYVKKNRATLKSLHEQSKTKTYQKMYCVSHGFKGSTLIRGSRRMNHLGFPIIFRIFHFAYNFNQLVLRAQKIFFGSEKSFEKLRG